MTLGGVSLDQGKRHPTLGDGVVVGAGAAVLGPFTVGDGARIGSNAVVVREVPPGATVVGIPARPAGPAAGGRRGVLLFALRRHPRQRRPGPHGANASSALPERLRELEERVGETERERHGSRCEWLPGAPEAPCLTPPGALRSPADRFIYLDHAATTPVRPEVVAAMAERSR